MNYTPEQRFLRNKMALNLINQRKTIKLIRYYCQHSISKRKIYSLLDGFEYIEELLKKLQGLKIEFLAIYKFYLGERMK